jgi:hypothetical protein
VRKCQQGGEFRCYAYERKGVNRLDLAREGGTSHERARNQTLTLSRHALDILHHKCASNQTIARSNRQDNRSARYLHRTLSGCLQEMEHLDPHQRPPDSIKDVYKRYQKMKPKDLDQDLDIIDLPDSLTMSAKDKVRIVEEWSGHELTAAFRAFSGQDGQTYADLPPRIPVYEHTDMPGRKLLCYVQRVCLLYCMAVIDTALVSIVILAKLLLVIRTSSCSRTSRKSQAP